MCVCVYVCVFVEGRKNMFYLTTHSTFFYRHHPTDRITHTTAFVTPVVEHWLSVCVCVCKLLGVVGMFDPFIIPSIIFRLTNFQEIVSYTRNLCSICRIFFHI